MDYIKSDTGATLEFKLSGSFGFSDNPKVRAMIGELEGSGASSVDLDLSGLTHVDSAGLGMIVLVNDSASSAGKALVIKGASGQVRKLLDISKFDQIMTVVD